jgi:hypothetical protein
MLELGGREETLLGEPVCDEHDRGPVLAQQLVSPLVSVVFEFVAVFIREAFNRLQLSEFLVVAELDKLLRRTIPDEFSFQTCEANGALIDDG